MEAIERGRSELIKRRRLNEVTVAAVLSGASASASAAAGSGAGAGEVLPVRSTKPLTEPKEFQFSTDKRLGKKVSKPK